MTYNIVFPFHGTPVNIASTDAGKPCTTDGSVLYERIDDGVDLMAKSGAGANIYAAADGTIKIQVDNSAGGGFGTYPVLMLDNPITLDNNVGKATGIYYGHVHSVLKPDANGLFASTKVKANDLIATTPSPPGGNATQLGWLEIGFWNDATGPVNHGTSSEAATNAGREMFKALFGDIASQAAGGPLGAASPGGDGSSSDNSGSSSQSDDDQKQIDAAKKYASTPQPKIDDPRDNRPFSPWFLGQVMGPWPGQTIDSAVAGPYVGQPHGEGGFRWADVLPPNFPVQAGSKMPYVNLVRGGMSEIPPREGGQLACFFMINPDSISFSINIDSSKATTDSLTSANQQAEYFTTAQAVNFTIWFNRMYEVWYGDMPSGGGPGPSSQGVRWDIRALERLVGLLDAVSDPAVSKIGLSNNSPMSGSAGSLPVQLVFGGANSMQFQGRVQSISYTYTRFDSNMIPVEASVDIGVQRVYNPPANADMVTLLQTNAPQVYSSDYSYTNWNALIKEPAGSRTGVIDPKTGQPTVPGIPNPNTPGSV